MFCPYCGTNNDQGARFCSRCGRQLREGEAKAPAGGPAWKDFAEPAPPPPEPEPPPQAPVQPEPAPQVVIGPPKRQLPVAALLTAVAVLGGIAAVGAGGYVAATNVDWDSLPLVGKHDGDGGNGGGTTPPDGNGGDVRPLVSLESACTDSQGRACRAAWDITAIEPGTQGIAISYRLSVRGNAGCSVPFAARSAALDTSRGLPGPYLEGGQGRYYPLTRAEGFLASGGAIECGGEPKSGRWVFAPAAGEQALKLRYPDLPPLRITTANPPTASLLPADDPISVIPAQSIACTTAANQPCTAQWEIGPYGFTPAGSPIVFFALRYTGPANCQVNWVPDLDFHRDATAKNEPGIRLQIVGDVDPLLEATGGVSAIAGPLPCAVVHYGYWQFTVRQVPSMVILIYPELPQISIPIRP